MAKIDTVISLPSNPIEQVCSLQNSKKIKPPLVEKIDFQAYRSLGADIVSWNIERSKLNPLLVKPHHDTFT